MDFKGLKAGAGKLWDRLQTSEDYIDVLAQKTRAMGEHTTKNYAQGLIDRGVDMNSKEFHKAFNENIFDKTANFLGKTSAKENIAIQNAAIQGFASGAIGGGIGSFGTDQSFMEGAFTGGLMGAGIGLGAKGAQIYKSRTAGGDIKASADRSKSLRMDRNRIKDRAPSTYDANWNPLAPDGRKGADIVDYLGNRKKNAVINKGNQVRANKRSNIDAQLKGESAKRTQLRSNMNGVSTNINPFMTGGLATAGSLAYATLNSNTPIGY